MLVLNFNFFVDLVWGEGTIVAVNLNSCWILDSYVGAFRRF
jgi:hypothetical protein